MRAAASAALAAAALIVHCIPQQAAALTLPAPDLSVDEPEFDIQRPPPGTRVQVEAHVLTYNSATRIATARGRVVLVYGPYVMVAENVTYDQNRDLLRATGQIRLREPGGNILEADLLQLQNKFRDGFAEHLRLLLTNNGTVTADYARRQDGVITIFERVTYTTCKTCVMADGTPLWRIRSRIATHDKTRREIRHEDMTFELAGVPVFWLPAFSHTDGTVERRSGFLTPELSVSKDIGVGVTVPYYWALDPSYDLTFLPLITTDQGIMPRAVWRQRTRKGEYFVDGAGIYQLNPDIPSPGDRRWRGSLHTAGKFAINPNWTWGWDATAMSDDTFMRRYDVDSRREIVSEAFITGIDDRNFFRARAMHFRNLIVENSDFSPVALPFVEHDYTFDTPVLGGELGVKSSVYNLYREESEITAYPGVVHGEEQSRATTTVHWQRQFISSAGTLATPFAKMRADFYRNEELPDDDLLDPEDDHSTSRLLPSAGLDLRWPFVRGTASGQHVVTPVAQFITASDETEEDEIGNEDAINLNFDTSNLFLHQKFSGEDRYEGGTRVNTGVLYSYLMPNGGFLRASLGESFHIAGENSFDDGSGLEGTQSDIVAALAFQPWDHLRFTYQARFDHGELDPAVQDTGIDLAYDSWTLSAGLSDVEAAPAYGRPTDELQAWAYATLPLRGGWSVFGGLRYDFEQDVSTYETFGLAFNCDCLNFRIAYVSNDDEEEGDLDKSHSVLFTVNFKGLGNNIGQ
ncbi:MAG TPA: LPS-assembly protein LptD [Aestuariivirgaceae bacterium]